MDLKFLSPLNLFKTDLAICLRTSSESQDVKEFAESSWKSVSSQYIRESEKLVNQYLANPNASIVRHPEPLTRFPNDLQEIIEDFLEYC